MRHVQILWVIFMNTAQLVPVIKMLPNSRAPIVCHTKKSPSTIQVQLKDCSKFGQHTVSAADENDVCPVCVEEAYPLVNSPTWKDVTLYTQYKRRVVKGISVTWCFQIFPLTKDTMDLASLFCHYFAGIYNSAPLRKNWYPGYNKDCCTSLL